MPMERDTNGARPPALRSRATNDHALLADVDGRSGPARRYRDVIESLISDLGGADLVSVAELLLVRRAAGLTVRLEQLEAQIILGEPIDSEQLSREINVLVRVLNAIGLKRRPRLVRSLAEHMAAKKAARQ